MMRLPITILLAMMLGAPAPALAAPREEDDAAYVRSVAKRVATHVDAGRYEQALQVLDDAERDRPHAVFVYMRATVEERRGDCERAIELYRRFLEHDVPPADADEARRGVERCGGDDDTASSTTETTDGDGPELVDDGGTNDEPPRRWLADPWGGVLVAAGVVGMGVGTGLVIRGQADARATATAPDLQTFDELSRRAERLDRAGVITLALGGALLAAGIVRYALVATRPRRRTSAHRGAHRLGPGLALRF